MKLSNITPNQAIMLHSSMTTTTMIRQNQSGYKTQLVATTDVIIRIDKN